jgi:hypothetical protein
MGCVDLENRRIFGAKSDEMTAEWRRLHGEELRDVYLPNIRFGQSSQEEWDGRGMWHV